MGFSRVSSLKGSAVPSPCPRQGGARTGPPPRWAVVCLAATGCVTLGAVLNIRSRCMQQLARAFVEMVDGGGFQAKFAQDILPRPYRFGAEIAAFQ